MKRILIRWEHGFGNNLFQYAFSKVFAELHGYDVYYSSVRNPEQSKMLNPIQYGFLRENVHIKYDCEIDSVQGMFSNILRPVDNISYGSYEQVFSSNKFHPNILMYFHTVMLDYRIYFPFLDKFKIWFPIQQVTNYDDLVVHIRLGDFFWPNGSIGQVIPQQIYLNAIEKIKFNKMYICTDDPSNKNYLSAFDKFSPEIVSSEIRINPSTDTNENSTVREFNFLRSFNKLLVGNGTFGWWAGALSQAKEIYIYKPFLKNSKGPDGTVDEATRNFFTIKWPLNLGETSYKNWNHYE